MTELLYYGAKVFTTGKGKANVIIYRKSQCLQMTSPYSAAILAS